MPALDPGLVTLRDGGRDVLKLVQHGLGRDLGNRAAGPSDRGELVVGMNGGFVEMDNEAGLSPGRAEAQRRTAQPLTATSTRASRAEGDRRYQRGAAGVHHPRRGKAANAGSLPLPKE